MNKEIYWREVELVKLKKKQLNERLEYIRLEYIDTCKPCNVGDVVDITLNSGRTERGLAASFGILKDGMVHVTSYKQGSKTRYITSPNKSVNVIKRFDEK